MPSALLAGAFGQRNPGDEALLDAFLASLPERWSGVATTSTPAATAAIHGCAVVDARRPAAVARTLLASDAVVFAGGTVFKALHASSGRRRGALLRNAALVAVASKALGRPVALVGVGVGDLDAWGAPTLARALVRVADLLVVRDEESVERLAAAGAAMPVRVAADPAWVLLAEPPVHAAPGDRVVVALSRVAVGAVDPRWLVDALHPVAAAGLPIALQPWQVGDSADDDAALARRLARAMAPLPVEILDPPRDVAAARALFTRSRAVVGLRFHALVAAASAGRPFVAVAHEPKLASAARRLGQDAIAPSLPPAALTAAVLRAAEAGDAGASPAAVRGEIALAEEGFRLLRLVLDGADCPDVDEVTGLPLVPGSS